MGLLVPSAFQRANGAAPLRRLLLDNGTIELWLDFLNSRGIFAIHRMFRFALLVSSRAARWRRETALRHQDHSGAEAAVRQPSVALSPKYIAGVSRELRTIPDVRSTDDALLYGRLHAAHPALGDAILGPGA